MKPKRIILVRHGESEGNKDECIYKTVPDYAVRLTQLGEEQATAAGRKIKDITKEDSVFFYISPMWRTRMTFKNIVQSFDKNKIRWREEPRIREQEWGHFKTPGKCRKIRKDRDRFGPFYYRIPDGESGADVYDRVSDFFGTLHRDFEKTDFPENTVIVTHGLTIRLFLMRWYHMSVEEFEELANPSNCSIFVMEIQESGKYKLLTQLIKNEPKERFSMPLNL